MVVDGVCPVFRAIRGVRSFILSGTPPPGWGWRQGLFGAAAGITWFRGQGTCCAAAPIRQSEGGIGRMTMPVSWRSAVVRSARSVSGLVVVTVKSCGVAPVCSPAVSKARCSHGCGRGRAAPSIGCRRIRRRAGQPPRVGCAGSYRW